MGNSLFESLFSLDFKFNSVLSAFIKNLIWGPYPTGYPKFDPLLENQRYFDSETPKIKNDCGKNFADHGAKISQGFQIFQTPNQGQGAPLSEPHVRIPLKQTIFAIKNIWHFGALWGQNLTQHGQIKSIRPLGAQGAQNRRLRTLKIGVKK